MEFTRCAGILLHPVSLPGPYGIGDLGSNAIRFVDFLKQSGQSLWQILPLSPTSYGDSPYQSFSTFAGNPLLISPELLMEAHYLHKEEIEPLPEFTPDKIDYSKTIQYKNTLYHKAFENFKRKATPAQKQKFLLFCLDNDEWLDDYALFMALKSYFIRERNGLPETSRKFMEYAAKAKQYMPLNQIKDCFYGAAWNSWPQELISRISEELRKYHELLANDILYHKFLQFEFYRQWGLLKNYANNAGVKIIGDLPIFVAYDSADAWANSDLFYLDEQGFPIEVAGVPPDYFSKTGQLWGNPLYRWHIHEEKGFAWWIQRIQKTVENVDILRIDHFRGFEAYWAVPFGEETAINGVWKKGPGAALFQAIEKALGKLPIIAEDLGVITPPVTKLRQQFNYPGMKVLQFAFDSGSSNAYLPHNYTDNRCVVYSGTHDNDTADGWYGAAPSKVKDFYRRYLNVSGEDVGWDLLRLAYSSVGNFAIVPLQDLMGLGSDARMNRPGEAGANWQWRFRESMLTPEISEGLLYLTQLYNREVLENRETLKASGEDDAVC